jgi:quercetin 2,3-dioxygenase
VEDGLISIRKSEERGHFNLDWLDTYHTFSFGEYRNPKFMGFSHLRVINQDRVQPLSGFSTHFHRDMEIITYMVSGTLTHKDDLGNDFVIRAGDVQRMTAGSGINHSEMNKDDKDVAHLLQIWILPDKKALEPEYQQKSFPDSAKRNYLCLVASSDGRENSLRIHQDTLIFACALDNNLHLHYNPQPGRGLWVQVIKGGLLVNDHNLWEGDGAAITDENELHLVGVDGTEFLLFDLP